MITIIAAVARNRAIGQENKLIYWLPNDLKRFKALTSGHTIVMGRKTFESLPKGALPHRRNVVISRGDSVQNWRSDDGTTILEVFRSLDEALKSCRPDEDIYVIGGASVYEQAMAVADRLCLTEIDDVPEQADAFFPDHGVAHHTERSASEGRASRLRIRFYGLRAGPTVRPAFLFLLTPHPA